MISANQSDRYSAPLQLAGRNGSAAFNRKMPGHIERLAKTRAEAEKRPDKINPKLAKTLMLGAIALLIAALAMFFTAHFFGDDLSRAGHSTSTKELEIVLGDEYLKVPSNKVRFFSQRSNGAHPKLDLYVHWPSLSGYKDELSFDFNNSRDNAKLIFLTIEPRTMSYEMSGRIEPIYKQFFDGNAETLNSGLIRQPLSAEGGYMDEDLYYAASSPYPFATRCVREAASTTPFCLRDIHVGKNLMLTYRFHKKHLASWIELEQAVRALTTSMIVSPTLKHTN